MAFEYPDDLKYTDSHEYARIEGDLVTIGITAFAIDQLGDIVFLELPEVGDEVEKGEKFGTIESVKAVEDLKSPVTGTVTEVNTALVDAPEELVEDPYIKGWMVRVQLDEADELSEAMVADAYRALVEGQ